MQRFRAVARHARIVRRYQDMERQFFDRRIGAGSRNAVIGASMGLSR